MVRQNHLGIGDKSSNKKGVCASALLTENTLDTDFNQMTFVLEAPDIPTVIDKTSFLIAGADEIVQGKGSNDRIILSLEKSLNNLNIIRRNLLEIFHIDLYHIISIGADALCYVGEGRIAVEGVDPAFFNCFIKQRYCNKYGKM